jgi:hypothetical protein
LEEVLTLLPYHTFCIIFIYCKCFTAVICLGVGHRSVIVLILLLISKVYLRQKYFLLICVISFAKLQYVELSAHRIIKGVEESVGSQHVLNVDALFVSLFEIYGLETVTGLFSRDLLNYVLGVKLEGLLVLKHENLFELAL